MAQAERRATVTARTSPPPAADHCTVEGESESREDQPGTWRGPDADQSRRGRVSVDYL